MSKISSYPEITSVAATDLLIITKDNGDTTFSTKKLQIANFLSPSTTYWKASATTGKASLTGPTTGTTRAKTVRDADDTILELGGTYTPTGTWVWTSASVTWPTFNQSTSGTAAGLSSTLAVTSGGTGTTTQFTAGSAVFAGASGVYTQDNSNFFWENANKRLGLGTNSLYGTARLAIKNATSLQNSIFCYNNDYNDSSVGTSLTIGMVDASGDTCASLQAKKTGGTAYANIILNGSGGSVGIGVSSLAAWLGGYVSLQMPGGAAYYAAGGDSGLTQNLYWSSTGSPGWKYIAAASTAATRYQQSAGTHKFSVMAPGTTGNNATGWVDALFIDNVGSVGIGTVAPDTLLHLNTGVDGAIITISEGANYKHTIRQTMSGVAANNYVAFDISSGSTTQASNVLVLQGDGKVGIGMTPSAYSTLGVAGNILVESSGGLRIVKTNGTPSADDFGIFRAGASGTTVFVIADWNTGAKGLSVDTSTGKVGIGTVAPNIAALHVAGGVGVQAVGTSSPGNGNGLQFGDSSGATIWMIKQSSYTPASSNLHIDNYNGSAWNNRLTILVDGKVGIGTTAPAALLDVTPTSTTTGIRAAGYDNCWGLLVYGSSTGRSYGLEINAGSSSNDSSFVVYEKTSTTVYFHIRGDGAIIFPQSPSVSPDNMTYFDNAGHFGKQTSSIRYKEDVQLMVEDFSKILNISTKTFKYKKDGAIGFGGIAEDFVDAGLLNLVNFNTDNQPENIKDHKIIWYLIEIMKQFKIDIDDLKEAIK
jgi:hypothetical protein